MSGTFNFTNANNRMAMSQGSRFQRVLEYLDADSVAIDITGFTFQLQVRKRIGQTVIVEASSANGDISITDAANGLFKIDIATADTLALAAGNYKYDLEYTVASEVTRLMEGDFEITGQVTV